MTSGVVLRTQSDGKLVSLASAGSEAAFEVIVRRYRRVLLTYCHRLPLSESRSEDVVQQALLNAWVALLSGTEVRQLRPWLYRITHNQAIRALRSPGYDFDELNESQSTIESPQSDLERRVFMRETLTAVAALPELQREAILRTAVDGHSYEEVARALGLTDHAVRGLIYRARASLRTGVAVLTPTPLVIWAAGQARRSTSLPPWLTEALAGGGTAGGGAVVLKGAAVLATSAAVIGGTVSGMNSIHPIAATAAQRHLNARSATASVPDTRGPKTSLLASRTAEHDLNAPTRPDAQTDSHRQRLTQRLATPQSNRGQKRTGQPDGQSSAPVTPPSHTVTGTPASSSPVYSKPPSQPLGSIKGPAGNTPSSSSPGTNTVSPVHPASYSQSGQSSGAASQPANTTSSTPIASPAGPKADQGDEP